MLRMEIALFLVVAFLAFAYFSAEQRGTFLHKLYSVVLVVMMIHLFFDGLTIYTVNRLDTIPLILNNIFHRLFIGTMILVMGCFFRYIAVLVEEELKVLCHMRWISLSFFCIAELAVCVLPVEYTLTPKGNYCSGPIANVCYIGVSFFLLLCAILLIKNWKQLDGRKKTAIGMAFLIQIVISLIQALDHTALVSGMGFTLMTLALYLTLENPDILKAELIEQKMSMLYLKSQVNPHFLYNTLDTIRIQAQLNGDKEVSDLLMRLVDFFRLSVKVNQSMVALDDELELLEAYMELMCYRYPELQYECDIDPELSDVHVPNFILQPIVENSLLHGLKNKGYSGLIRITALQKDKKHLEIQVSDTGSGFAEGKKEAVEQLLKNYAKHAPKLTGNSIGVLNVQKRIKLFCGKDCGLSYTENENGGLTAHLLLSMEE